MACDHELRTHVRKDMSLCDDAACIVDHDKPGKKLGSYPHVCGCGYAEPSVTATAAPAKAVS